MSIYGNLATLVVLAHFAFILFVMFGGLLALTKIQVTDLMLALILGVLVGGRLGYIVVYEPALLTEFSSSPPWCSSCRRRATA